MKHTAHTEHCDEEIFLTYFLRRILNGLLIPQQITSSRCVQETKLEDMKECMKLEI